MIFPDEPFGFKILTALEVEREKGFSNPCDRNFHAISFRIKGDAVFLLEDKSIHAGAGDILFAPENIKYSLKNEYEKMYIVHFETSQKMPETVCVLNIKNKQYVQTLFERMHKKWKTGKSIDKYAVYSDFYKLIAEINAEENADEFSANKRLEKVIDYIHDNYRECNISVKKLAEIYCASEPSFRTEFGEKYGITPNKYIQKLRLEYAIELLESGYFGVLQVAEMSGFNDVKYFSRFVKKHTGRTPSDFFNKL